MQEMTLNQTLLAYSEWLDGQNLCFVEGHPRPSEIDLWYERSHEELVRAFVAHWLDDPNRALLTGTTSEDIVDGALIAGSIRTAYETLVAIADGSAQDPDGSRNNAAVSILNHDARMQAIEAGKA